MKHYFYVWIVEVVMTSVCSVATSQGIQPSTKTLVDSFETEERFMRTHPTGRYATQITGRNIARREIQRHGYSSTLLELLNQDAISALLSYFRMSAQVQFSLPHDILFWIRRPDPEHGIEGIPFVEDWAFPPDPWKAE